MPTHKLLCDLDVGGEVKGTSLDINGNGDISGNLTFGHANSVIEGATSGNHLIVGGNSDISLRIAGSTKITMDGTKCEFSIPPIPGTSDGAALGSATKMWSDLFLASGSVVNFNNGDMTLTHSSNTLTVAGGTFATAALTATTGTFSGNITANGNIVGDDGTQITNIDSIGADSYTADADSTTRITMGATSIDCLVADTDIFQIGEDNFTFDGAVKTVIKKRKFAKTTNTDGNADGDIVYFGGTTSMVAGKIYYYNSSGNWALADADAESTASGMLGVALGSASDTNGVLIRGMVTIANDPGAVGDVLYVSTSAGQAVATAPSGTGDIVRVVGYCLDASNGQIYFNPDGAFVEVA